METGAPQWAATFKNQRDGQNTEGLKCVIFERSWKHTNKMFIFIIHLEKELILHMCFIQDELSTIKDY